MTRDDLLDRLKEYLKIRTDEIMQEIDHGTTDESRLQGKFAMLQEIYSKIAAWEDSHDEPF